VGLGPLSPRRSPTAGVAPGTRSAAAGVPQRQGIRIEPHGMQNDQRYPVTHTPGLLRVYGEFQNGSDTELASREAPQAPYGLAAPSYRPTDWRRPDASGEAAAILGSVSHWNCWRIWRRYSDLQPGDQAPTGLKSSGRARGRFSGHMVYCLSRVLDFPWMIAAISFSMYFGGSNARTVQSNIQLDARDPSASPAHL
jgi:hypothetical protein